MVLQRLLLTALLFVFSSLTLNAQQILSIDSDSLQSTYQLGDTDTVTCTIENVSSSDTLYEPIDVLYLSQQKSNEGLFVDSFSNIIHPGDIKTVQAIFKATGQFVDIGQNKIDLFSRGLFSGVIRSDSTTKTITIKDTVSHPLAIDLNPDDSAQTILEDTLRMGAIDTFLFGITNNGNAPIDTTIDVLYQGKNVNQVGTIKDSAQINLAPKDSDTMSGTFNANSAYVPGGPSGVAIWPSFTADPGSLAGDTVTHNIFIKDTTSSIPNQYKATPNAVEIYPNPAAQAIQVNSKNGKSIEYVRIRTLGGKTIKTYQGSTNTIPLNNLKQGTYLLRIQFEDHTMLSKKVIKRP